MSVADTIIGEIIECRTNHPVAADSPDHLHPFGTAQDNSRNREFNRRLYSLFQTGELRPDGSGRVNRKINIMDIGCAGGGFVKDCIDDGNFAVGIDGSDFCRRHQRFEWATIQANLFTADATKPFRLCVDGQGFHFNAITAWEFIEHLREDQLAGFFANVHTHLVPGGYLILSVSTVDSKPRDVEYHQTIRPKDWWMDQFIRGGFTWRGDLFKHFDPHWIRGPGNAWGFNVVLQESLP